MLKLRKNKKGFTLVELIVVIAIMAVLAGVVAGVTVSTLNKNTDKTAYSEIGTLASALDAYLSAEDVDATNFKATVEKWILEYQGEHGASSLTNAEKAPKAGSHEFKYAWNGSQITFSFTAKANGSKNSRTYEFNDKTGGIKEVTAAAPAGGGEDGGNESEAEGSTTGK